jgi:hypothetical protein
MPECRTVRHQVGPGIGMKTTNDAGNGPVPFFFVGYRTEIMDGGMSMPALGCSMPMTSYVYSIPTKGKDKKDTVTG